MTQCFKYSTVYGLCLLTTIFIFELFVLKKETVLWLRLIMSVSKDFCINRDLFSQKQKQPNKNSCMTSQV